MGIPFSRWGATPFVYSPIPFPIDIIEEIGRKNKEETEVLEACLHPFELALMWRQQINDDPTLNKAKIAAREGISRARVSQIMDLLKLPAEVQERLLRPPGPLKIYSFPERRLRLLVRCGSEEAQIRRRGGVDPRTRDFCWRVNQDMHLQAGSPGPVKAPEACKSWFTWFTTWGGSLVDYPVMAHNLPCGCSFR